MEILVNRLYKHFRGNIYRVLGFVKDSETLESKVIYENVLDLMQPYVRPISEFSEIVELENGEKVQRFTLIENTPVTKNDSEYYGLLVDHQIKELLNNGLIKYPEQKLINTSSLDCRLGSTAMKDKPNSLLKRICIFINKLRFFDEYCYASDMKEGDFLFDLYLKYRGILEAKNYFEYFNFSRYTSINPYWLKPKECLLISTLEEFNLPADIAASLKLKSSRAREGLNHALAGWIDNEFSGVLTLELTNVSKHSIPIYPGLRIGQLLLIKTLVPTKTYKNGRYAKQNKVIQSLD